MQYLPPPPPPAAKRNRPWLVIVLSVLGTLIVLGVIGAVMNQPKSPPVVITLPSPSPVVVSPSPIPLPEATPAVTPMAEAIQDVHEGVFIQQFCNLASRAVPILGWTRYANVVATTNSAANSIGRVWRDASVKWNIPLRQLMQAVYQRYC